VFWTLSPVNEFSSDRRESKSSSDVILMQSHLETSPTHTLSSLRKKSEHGRIVFMFIELKENWFVFPNFCVFFHFFMDIYIYIQYKYITPVNNNNSHKCYQHSLQIYISINNIFLFFFCIVDVKDNQCKDIHKRRYFENQRGPKCLVPNILRSVFFSVSLKRVSPKGVMENMSEYYW